MCALRSLPKPDKMSILAIGEGSRFFVVCFISAAKRFPSDACWPSPHITGLRVETVTLGCVGAPTERAPFRFRHAVSVFADRCLTRTRIADLGLGVS